MSSLFGILNTARSGLYASQLALQTASNNVANAGTAGYSRQAVDLAEGFPESYPFGQVGTGVAVEGARRVRDQFLDRQYYQAQQQVGEGETALSTLRQIEALLNEPSDSGLQASLTGFFSALTDLASYPEDLTTRRAVLEQGATLAADFNRLSAGLTAVKANLGAEIGSTTDQVNGLAREIAALNVEIQAVRVGGGSPNALLDSRDLKLDELSGLIGVTSSIRSDGSVAVALAGGGGPLVDNAMVATLEARFDAVGDCYQLYAGANPVASRGGKLAGLLEARNGPDGSVKSAMGMLDELAAGLIGAVNRLQAVGAGQEAPQSLVAGAVVADPAAPLASGGLRGPLTLPGSFRLFVYDRSSGAVVASGSVTIAADSSLDDLASRLEGVGGLTVTTDGGRLSLDAGSGRGVRFAADTSGVLGALGVGGFFTGQNAATIAVSRELTADPRRLATALPDSTTGAVGASDNRVALEMAALRSAKCLAGESASPTEFYAAGIGSVGARIAALERSVESHGLVRDSIQARREEVSGVSLDEEMVELIRFQRAFEASSRVIRLTDELLNTIINGLLS